MYIEYCATYEVTDYMSPNLKIIYWVGCHGHFRGISSDDEVQPVLALLLYGGLLRHLFHLPQCRNEGYTSGDAEYLLHLGRPSIFKICLHRAHFQCTWRRQSTARRRKLSHILGWRDIVLDCALLLHHGVHIDYD